MAWLPPELELGEEPELKPPELELELPEPEFAELEPEFAELEPEPVELEPEPELAEVEPELAEVEPEPLDVLVVWLEPGRARASAPAVRTRKSLHEPSGRAMSLAGSSRPPAAEATQAT